MLSMENALILIVEDEPQIADILVAFFERDGFRTVRAADGETAIAHHRMLKPDLIVLDIKLPKKDGTEVLIEIRKTSDTPIIMASALGEDLEKLTALKVGADDYIVKPYNPLEVVARARGVLRRASAPSTSSLVRVGMIEIDHISHMVHIMCSDGRKQTIDLTLTEFRLLAHMARVAKKVFSRAELLDACLPQEGDALERTVDSHISKLRKKLEAAGALGYLEGIRGVGYRLLAR